MDIYSTIMRDHMGVDHLFTQADRAVSIHERSVLFQKIRDELTLHAQAEEATFYACFAKEAKLRGKNNYIRDEAHAEDEHDIIREQIEAVAGSVAGSPEWDNAFTKLREAVQHHVKEEENDFFKKAREVIPQHEAMRLGFKMEQVKEQLRKKMNSERLGGQHDNNMLGKLTSFMNVGKGDNHGNH